MSETKNFIKRLLYDLTIFGMVLSLVFRFGVSVSNVTSGSMEGSVETGDRVILLPWVYGGKTPQTPIGLPFLRGTKIFGFRTYLPWIQLPVYRAPGYKPRKGEVVTFDPTIDIDNTDTAAKSKSWPPSDTLTPLLKRIGAIAGDRVQIVDGKVFVDGSMQDMNAKYRQYCFTVKLNGALNTDWLNKNTREWKSVGDTHTYNLTMTLAQKETFDKYCKTQDIRILDSKLKEAEAKPTKGHAAITNDMKKVTVPYCRWDDKHKRWDALTIDLNKDTHPLYIATLENTEPRFQKEEKGGEIRFYLDGKQIYQYTFKENFFFPIGDNFHASKDGRSFGFVPYKNINAKAYRVLFNFTTWNKGKGGRFLHKIPADASTDESGLLLFSIFLLVLFALIGSTLLLARKRE